MSTVRSCDVCRTPFPEDSSELETMALRCFTNAQPAMVAISIDLCRKSECREAGVAQLTTQALALALEALKANGAG